MWDFFVSGSFDSIALKAMRFFVTTVDVCCDDFIPEYYTRFFETRKAFEAYLGTLEDDEVHSSGELDACQQEYYTQAIPFW